MFQHSVDCIGALAEPTQYKFCSGDIDPDSTGPNFGKSIRRMRAEAQCLLLSALT